MYPLLFLWEGAVVMRGEEEGRCLLRPPQLHVLSLAALHCIFCYSFFTMAKNMALKSLGREERVL